MWKAKLFYLVSAISLITPFSAEAQSKLNCQVDPISGLPVATIDWQNTLGRVRADGWCRRMLSQGADENLGLVPGESYVALKGHGAGERQKIMTNFDRHGQVQIPQKNPVLESEYMQIKPRQ